MDWKLELVERGTDVSEIFHFESGSQVPGPALARQVPRGW